LRDLRDGGRRCRNVASELYVAAGRGAAARDRRPL